MKKMMAKTMANAVERKSVMMEGSLLAMSMPVTTGTIISQREMSNLSARDWVNSLIWMEDIDSYESPAIVKMVIVMIKEGIVVIIKYLIWVNKGVPAVDEASTVVSDKGEILSPK